jgi:hypothetical protein
MTNYAILHEKLNPSLPWQKQQSTRKLVIEKLYSNLRKKLLKCCIWSITFCGAEKWTLREVYQKYLESFELWCWRSREKIICTVGVKNEVVILHRVKKERDILHTMKRRKAI